MRQYGRLLVWLVALLALLALSSCGSLPSFLLGGGPNVAANTQIGRENTQTIGVNNSVRPVLKTEGPVETVVQDNSTTKNTEVDPLLILLLILGWLAPSPSEIGRYISNLFRRNNS